MKISRQKLIRIVKSMRGRRIGVVGDVMLDRYVWGKPSKLSPEAPVPVVEFTKEEFVLGGAANVAANLVTLGAQVALFGVSGEDVFAELLRGCLRNQQIPEAGITPDLSRKTTVKTRVIAGHQQVVRVDRETRVPLTKEIQEKLIRRIIAALRRMDALVVSDYDKGVVTDELADRVLGASQKLGVRAFVKPKWSRMPTYTGATAIVCNRQEAAFFVQRSTLDDDQSVEQAGRALLAHFGCPVVVITRGEQGMSVFVHDAPQGFHISAVSRERPNGRLGRPGLEQRSTGRQVFDVTGAGDTALATLALADAAGAPIHEAAVLANAAASVVVGKLGTATLTPAELLAAMSAMF